MAKGHMFIGKVRGKMGGVVFRVSNGKQIASEYNPAPFNPKSKGQSVQRFKFAFVQAIASQIPSVELEGLGGRALARRSELLKAMLNNVVVDGVSDPIESMRVRLDAGAIPFARGPLARPSISTTVEYPQGGEVINIVLSTEDSGTGIQVRNAIFITPNTAIKGEVKPLVIFADAQFGGATVEIELPELWKQQTLAVQVVTWMKALPSSEVVQRYLDETRGVANELIGAPSAKTDGTYMYSDSYLTFYDVVQPAE